MVNETHPASNWSYMWAICNVSYDMAPSPQVPLSKSTHGSLKAPILIIERVRRLAAMRRGASGNLHSSRSLAAKLRRTETMMR